MKKFNMTLTNTLLNINPIINQILDLTQSEDANKMTKLNKQQILETDKTQIHSHLKLNKLMNKKKQLAKDADM